MSEELSPIKSQKMTLPDVNIDINKWMEIAYKCCRGEIIDAEDIADYLKLSYSEGLAILMHPTFATFVHNVQIAVTKHKYNLKVLPKLADLAQSSEGDIAIKAAKELADVLGYSSKHKAVGVQAQQTNVHIHLEGMIDRLKERDVILDITNKPTPFPGFDDAE